MVKTQLPKAVLLALLIGTLVPDWAGQPLFAALLLGLASFAFGVSVLFFCILLFAKAKKRQINGGKSVKIASTTRLQIGLYAFFDCMLIASGFPATGTLFLTTKALMLTNINLVNSVAK